MGFFFFGDRTDDDLTISKLGVQIESLHRLQCAICPLNLVRENLNPHMTPYGTSEPLVYILGEAPGREEDEQGRPFVGEAGQQLDAHIPAEWLPLIRWSNVVRTRPPKNRDPSLIEIECCRPSVVADIEQTKPAAIFGFGNVPLHWAIKQAGITKWNGRRIPLQVGAHKCWYFPMMHPAYVMRDPHATEFVFALDLHRAFEAVAAGLPEPIIHTVEDALADTEMVTGAHRTDADTVIDFLTEAASEKVVGIDLETKGLRPYADDARILTAAISMRRRTLAWPLYHREAAWSDADLEAVEQAFVEFLYTANCRKVSFASAFEMEWLGYFYGAGVIRAGKWGDAQAQAYIINERQGSLNLDFKCIEYFGLSIKSISNIDAEHLDETPLEAVLPYNALDAKYHRALYLAQLPDLKEQGQMQLYQHHMRRIAAVVLTQLKGIPVDQDVAAAFNVKYGKLLAKLSKKVAATEKAQDFRREFGRDFRPAAPKDVLKIFPGESSDKSILHKIKDPLAKLIIEWRETAKILKTYIAPCLATAPTTRIYPDGLLHPVLNLHKTRTDRSSADQPNIQNFPRHYGEAREIRSMIKPRRGHKVVSFDYAGIQVRNIAMESQDAALIDAFWHRHDTHAYWRDRIIARYPKWVSAKQIKADKELAKEYRQKAKSFFVFASLFGAQPPKIAAGLGVPEIVAEDLLDELYDFFPGVPVWHKDLKQFYYAQGYVTGLGGFRRHAPVKMNEIINAPIQGDEAAIVLDAMVRLSELGEDPYQPNMEIHDSLDFIWPTDKIDQYAEVVIEHMLMCPFEWAHCVPLVVEMSVGDDWANLKGAGEYETTREGTWREVPK